MSSPPAKAPAPAKAVAPPRRAPPPKAKAAAAPAQVSGPKLRPLFWTATAKATEGSIWDGLEPPAPFDPKLLEKHFTQAAPRANPIVAKAQTEGDVARKRLRLLDDKSSQMLAIACSRLPPPEALAGVLRTLDSFPECLPAEAVLVLHAAAADQANALKQLQQYGPQDLEKLDLPERYLWAIGTVPDSLAKLACGAAILGPALELPDLCAEADLVSICCHEFRYSKLVVRCISTSLAVGNHVNRGTARGEAKAVVLPDSLLKLEDLRGSQDAEDGGPRSSDRSGVTSLLDIVAQALVDERGAPTAHEMRAEADILLAKTLAAKSVCLDGAEEHCQKVYSTAMRAVQGMATIADEGAAGLSERVRGVCDEAQVTQGRLREAKKDLAAAQVWSSARQGQKGEEWFAAWAQFFQQLGLALSRARARPRTSCLPASPCREPASAEKRKARLLDSLSEEEEVAAEKAPLDVYVDGASPAKEVFVGSLTFGDEAAHARFQQLALASEEAAEVAPVRASRAVPVLVETVQAAAVADAVANAVPRAAQRTPLGEKPSRLQVPAPRQEIKSATKTGVALVKASGAKPPVARKAVQLDDNARAEDMTNLFSKLKEQGKTTAKAAAPKPASVVGGPVRVGAQPAGADAKPRFLR